MAVQLMTAVLPTGRHTEAWIGTIVALIYVLVGIPFILGRRWARRAMGVLMVIAILLFLQVLGAAGMAGNRLGVSDGAVVVGIAGYTLLFLAVSSRRDSPNLR